MKKHGFHLAQKEYFSFFAITEPDTSHAATLFHTLGSAFSAMARAKRYGTGVRNVAVTLLLTDPEGLGRAHKLKRPKYTAGLKVIKAHGITVAAEDSLEFGLRPSFSEVRDLRSESDAAAVLLSVIDQAESALAKVQVRDFDKDLFLADLRQFLERAKVQGPYAH